jgi:hypothetical protein
LFLPVKEEKDLHLHREFIEKEVLMEEMEVVEDTFSCRDFGLYFT